MHETRSPVWPFTGVVMCLAAMTLAAIWSWQQQSGPLATKPLATRFNAVGASMTAASPGQTARPERATDSVTQSDSTPPPDSESLPVVASSGAASEAASRDSMVKSLADFAVMPRYRRPSPPVADRITFDPSLAETPALPMVEPSLRSEAGSSRVAVDAVSRPPDPDPDGGSLSRQDLSRAAAIATPWPLPVGLFALLEQAAVDPPVASWVERVGQQLDELHRIESLGDPRAGVLLADLQALVHEGMQLAERQQEINARAATMRAAFALQRRLAIWQPVHTLAAPRVAPVSLRHADAVVLAEAFQAADRQLLQLRDAKAWREYLLLDDLAALASQQWLASSHDRSRIARAFLQRLESADASGEQERFFSELHWQQLASEVRQWVCEPVDYAALLDTLEIVETDEGEGPALAVARDYQILRWSPTPEIAELGERINSLYRNANVRIAISGELLNRLLPQPTTVSENVNDRLMGGRVLGRSRVTTRLRLVLMPDAERWRMGLQAEGDVDSQTQTERGPARFHNAGRSRFQVLKMLMVDRRGIHAEDAEGSALTNADLTRMETDVDGVPLVNLLVRAVARQMYDRQSDEAESEAEGLLAHRVESRIDTEVHEKLGEATAKFREVIWQPLRGLGLRPEAVDMQTTDERLIVRYRLAGYEQLAACSPRPQAPSDSLISIQVHESMLNNVVRCLDLGGREVGLRDLFLEVAQKLERPNYQVPEDVPEDVTLELAAQDPIRFQCCDDRIHLTLRIARLAAGDGRQWTNFEVRGMYLPAVTGMEVGLERDSYIRLKGLQRRLPMGDQVALRAIFARVLAQHPDVDLLGNVLVRDPRLHNLRVSQFVISDGWIGIAVGEGDPVKMHVADEATHAQVRWLLPVRSTAAQAREEPLPLPTPYL